MTISSRTTSKLTGTQKLSSLQFPLKTVFLGTPDFACAALELLHHHPLIELIDVVSMPDRPAGRGHDLKSPEVAEYAKKHRLPLIQTADINSEDVALKKWNDAKVDLIIVLAFAQFLKKPLLSLPRLGCFNIHTSLLPKFRGAAPIQYALLKGESHTGVSLQKMVSKMDAGDIIHSHTLPIADYEHAGLLSTRLKFQAALTLNEFIHQLSLGSYSFTPQDETHVSFAPTLKKEDGLLNFSQSQKNVLNQFRALYPWPGTYFFISHKRIKVLGLEVPPHHLPQLNSLKPSELKAFENQLFVGTADGPLRLKSLQPEGKKICSDTEFLNGWREPLTLTSSSQSSQST